MEGNRPADGGLVSQWVIMHPKADEGLGDAPDGHALYNDLRVKGGADAGQVVTRARCAVGVAAAATAATATTWATWTLAAGAAGYKITTTRPSAPASALAVAGCVVRRHVVGATWGLDLLHGRCGLANWAGEKPGVRRAEAEEQRQHLVSKVPFHGDCFAVFVTTLYLEQADQSRSWNGRSAFRLAAEHLEPDVRSASAISFERLSAARKDSRRAQE